MKHLLSFSTLIGLSFLLTSCNFSKTKLEEEKHSAEVSNTIESLEKFESDTISITYTSGGEYTYELRHYPEKFKYQLLELKYNNLKKELVYNEKGNVVHAIIYGGGYSKEEEIEEEYKLKYSEDDSLAEIEHFKKGLVDDELKLKANYYYEYSNELLTSTRFKNLIKEGFPPMIVTMMHEYDDQNRMINTKIKSKEIRESEIASLNYQYIGNSQLPNTAHSDIDDGIDFHFTTTKNKLQFDKISEAQGHFMSEKEEYTFDNKNQCIKHIMLRHIKGPNDYQTDQNYRTNIFYGSESKAEMIPKFILPFEFPSRDIINYFQTNLEAGHNRNVSMQPAIGFIAKPLKMTKHKESGKDNWDLESITRFY